MTEEQVFLAALDLPDAAARTAYLDEACGGDAGLRRKAESLLAAHYRSGEFLDVPAVDLVNAARSDPNTAAIPGGAVPDEAEPDALRFLTPSSKPGSLGRLGHYEVLQVLGRGGFGVVFRAFDETLQRVVAVKVLAPQMAVTSPARKRFLREARSSAKVRHAHVVQVYAVEEQPLPYLVMEFIPGETLQQRLDRTGPLEPIEAARIGRQIAEGLAAAHGTGLVHRDIKPANVLLEAGPHPCVKITDFGLARAADDASVTQSGFVAGTPMYMAPEQANGEPLDHRADLFSLGSVMYTMCTGRPPFRANGALAVLKRVAEDTPRPIKEIIPEVPAWLCDVIARLHAKKPQERFATAREVADLIGHCLEETQPHGQSQASEERKPPVEPFPPTGGSRPPLAGKRRWVFAAALALLLAGLGLSEATGVTDVRGTVIRLVSPEGTLVIEVDDPGVSVQIDGSDVVITGAGVKEIRLKPGRYAVEARKDGKVVQQELVTVTNKGRRVVRVSQEGPPPPWTVLKPIERKSEGGATLTPQDDGSILAGGKHPDQDAYTLAFHGLPARVQVIRLEVLPHSTLPNHGPGRHENGEFILTKIKAQLDPLTGAKPAEPRLLKLTKAWADNCRGDDSVVKFALDEDDGTGWVTEVGKPHFAVFALAEPVATPTGTVLRVTLEFKHPQEARHLLGCFRLSVASDANAVRPEK